MQKCFREMLLPPQLFNPGKKLLPNGNKNQQSGRIRQNVLEENKIFLSVYLIESAILPLCIVVTRNMIF